MRPPHLDEESLRFSSARHIGEAGAVLAAYAALVENLQHRLNEELTVAKHDR